MKFHLIAPDGESAGTFRDYGSAIETAKYRWPGKLCGDRSVESDVWALERVSRRPRKAKIAQNAD